MGVLPKRDWSDPYYRYVLPSRPGTIDVTGSIPNFDNEVDGLSDVVAEFRRRGFKRICDFGAGKLRNTLYLLRKGFKVWAVEFPKAFEPPGGKKQFDKARKYDGFFFLKYPEAFLAFREKVDAILLINVIHIVPLESERKKILRECRGRLKEGGLLFWMSVYGEPHYKPAVTKRLSVEDGWCYNLHKQHQTFYKEYKIPDVQALVTSAGYSLVRPIAANHHRAFLFQKP